MLSNIVDPGFLAAAVRTRVIVSPIIVSPCFAFSAFRSNLRPGSRFGSSEAASPVFPCPIRTIGGNRGQACFIAIVPLSPLGRLYSTFNIHSAAKTSARERPHLASLAHASSNPCVEYAKISAGARRDRSLINIFAFLAGYLAPGQI